MVITLLLGQESLAALFLNSLHSGDIPFLHEGVQYICTFSSYPKHFFLTNLLGQFTRYTLHIFYNIQSLINGIYLLFGCCHCLCPY